MLNKAKRDYLAQRIVFFHVNVANCDSAKTWNHFKIEGISKSTFYGILARYQSENRIETKSPPGRIAKKMTSEVLRSVENHYISNPSVSESIVAAKMKLPVSTIGHIKRKKLGLKSRVKITMPKSTPVQQQTSKKNAGKIIRKLYGKSNSVLIIDDETYVPADPTQIPGRHFYTTSDPENVPIEDRIKCKTKFPKRYLVWQAIDEHGNISTPFITDRTLTADIYLKKCLKTKLLNFIKKNHPIESVIFWPDMATSHYAKLVIEWLLEKGIDFVAKDQNCPNLPQARPIEKFWALCKAEYAKQGQTAENLTDFTRIWTKISKKVARNSGLNLMSGVRRKLMKVYKEGVFSIN